ncbi:hypothetical protein [Serratia microhaemolytica]|uniref:hypothetical protein n=1 Tax=Serratia microhaemolytica TaxID=2675110 RepID=UPI000FDE3E57|nr:hypothetical protein [Serratia microhaemolytica]
MNQLTVTGITMTSLELVDYINTERAEKAKTAGADFPSKGHALLRHDQFMVKVPKVLGEASPKFLGDDVFTVGNGAKTVRKIYRFPKREACLMAMSYSYELQAKVFDRMTALEEQQRTVLPPTKEDQVKCGLLILESAAKLLNLSNSSRLVALQRLQEFAGVPALMPAYAIDAPSDATDGSSRTTAALTTLLKRHGAELSTPIANVILERLGILERKQRHSRRYGLKQFWSVTSAGLVYGKNLTDPHSPRETQPHFYESRFPRLLQRIYEERGRR